MGKHETPDQFDGDTAGLDLANVVNYWRHISTVQLAQLEATNRHLDYAHAAVQRARQELRTLNEVILRRKRTAKRQREFIIAVKALHRPVDGTDLDNTKCREDGQKWPCRTHDAIETLALEAMPEALKVALLGEALIAEGGQGD